MERTDLDQMAMQIKEKRKAYGYTQEEMAEQLNISYSFYTKIENGFQAPSLDTLIRIATTLQISLDKLIFGNSRTAFFSGCAGTVSIYQSIQSRRTHSLQKFTE